MKVWELERTAKRILVDSEQILAEYSYFSYEDYTDIFPQDEMKTDAKNIMLISGAVEGRKQTYSILLVYKYSDRPLYLALIGEDGVLDVFDYESKKWQKRVVNLDLDKRVPRGRG